jgi:hypothetical protein
MEHSSANSLTRLARSIEPEKLNITAWVVARPGWSLRNATPTERAALRLRFAAGRDLTPADLSDPELVRTALAPASAERPRLSPTSAPCRCRCRQCRAEGCRR